MRSQNDLDRDFCTSVPNYTCFVLSTEFGKQVCIVAFLFLGHYFSRRVFQEQLGYSGSAAANDFTSAQYVIALYEHRHCVAAAPVSREIGE